MPRQAAATDLPEPLTYDEAITGPESPHWREAIENELKSLEANHTWSTVPQLPPGHNLIGCKWVFKRKLNLDGTVARYKARLVAKGFNQQYGIDYEETYAPVAKFPSIRALIAIGNYLDLEIHQMDVKTAFLNGELEEEIYMSPPDGISKKGICKLNRTLYGLKQSPRMWNKKIDDFLVSKQRFTRLNADHGTYIRRDEASQSIAIIAIYVDDLLILTSNLSQMDKLKSELKKAFEMTDCGEVHHFLGIRITRDRSKRHISLDQSHLADQVLKRHGMHDCKPSLTPLETSNSRIEGESKATNSENTASNPENMASNSETGPINGNHHGNHPGNQPDKSVDASQFRQIIGGLMYLMTGTRPDLAAAIGILSQYSANPGTEHMQAAKRTLRYLKGTKDARLSFDSDGNNPINGNNPIKITGFCDANWGNDVITRRSTTGYLFYLCGQA